MSEEFPRLSGEDLKNAKINEADMLKGGAEYDDNGLVLTEQQVEAAKGEMVTDVLIRKVHEIFLMPKADLDMAIAQLQDEVAKINKSNVTYEQRFKEELLSFLKRAKEYADYGPTPKEKV